MIIETFGHEVLVAANIDTQHDVPFVLRSNHEGRFRGLHEYYQQSELLI